MLPMLQYAVQFKQLYTKYFQALGEELNLSQTEIDILLFLRNNPELNTARDVAAMRGLARSNVSSAVERLQRGRYSVLTAVGLLPIAVAGIDIQSLMDGAREEMERLAQCQEECFAAVLRGISPQEREELGRLFGRLRANIQQALQEMK